MSVMFIYFPGDVVPGSGAEALSVFLHTGQSCHLQKPGIIMLFLIECTGY